MRGLLVYNGFIKSRAFDDVYDALLFCAQRRGIAMQRMTNDALCPFSEKVLKDAYDFVLFWDKDVRLAWQMEAKGMRVFNCAKSIVLCDDKTLTYLALKDCVPMPQTILAPQTFDNFGRADFLVRVGETLGYPYVLKEGCGSFGQQVYLIDSLEQAKEKLSLLGAKPLLFQRFVKSSFGRDARLYMVGETCVAAMERVSRTGDFRANIQGGGCAKKYTPSKAEVSLARGAMRRLGLTFAGVDILFGEDAPLLCEVNSNAHFTALSALTGVNPADFIFEEILRQCAAR